ncbi:UDP-glucose 6-dehydrogenase [Geobacillus stearothermophilus]|uniref:UDP-glucose 6-dehydrogenase n=1 Tax=Geobacillus stearothermophilus TaxID=1422 RepID=UPI003D1D0CF6
MKKFPWNERCIEHSLEQLPMVKDRRTKEDVYERLQRTQRKMRWRRRWLSAASMALFLAVVAVGMNAAAPERAEQQQRSSTVKTLGAESAPPQVETIMAADAAPAQEDAGVMVVGLPDAANGRVVPVAVPLSGRLAPEERFTAALRVLGRSPLRAASAWFDGVVIQPAAGGTGEWMVHVPAQHRVFSASRKEQKLFVDALVETARQMGERRLRFFTGEKEGLELPALGMVKTTKIKERQRMYYKNSASFGYTVLVPAPDSARTFSEALKQMKTSTIRGLEPAIPPGVNVELADMDARHATVRIQLTAQPHEEDAARMAEAVLLTAKEFGFREVTFAADGLSNLGPYPVGMRIRVPAGPNALLMAAGW